MYQNCLKCDKEFSKENDDVKYNHAVYCRCGCGRWVHYKGCALNSLLCMNGDIFVDIDCGKHLSLESEGEASGVEVELAGFKVYRLGMMWVDVVHLTLYHLTTLMKAENTIEGLHFYHWRVICDTIDQFWPVLWDKPKSGNWQALVAAALSSYSGKRFFNGKDLKLERYWSLMLLNRAPSDIEALLPFPRQRAYMINFEGSLAPIIDTNPPTDHDQKHDPAQRSSIQASLDSYVTRSTAISERKIQRQIKHLTTEHTFSNLDFDRPNPTGIPFVCFSTLPSNTSSRLITKASRVNRSFDERYRDLVVSDSSRIGYRMARGTHGIDRPGSWYFEVSIGCDLINIEKNSTEQSFNYLTKAESLSTDENPIDLAFLKVSSNPKDTATESHFGHDTAYSEDLKNIKKSTNKGHIRLGIAQILAQTEAPVGFDEYGYGIRSTDGSTIHCATVDESVKNIGFSPGDIVGVLVCLPEENSMMSDDGRITLMTKADTFDEFRQVLRAPDQKLSNQNNVDKLTSKGINVYNFTDPKRSKIKDSNLDNSEEIKTLDEPLEKMQKIYRPLGLGEYKVCQELHPHSSVRFFINGSEVQNFSPIYRAKYYPAVSLYGDAAAILNCGPNFVHLSSTLAYGNVSPVCELAKFDS